MPVVTDGKVTEDNPWDEVAEEWDAASSVRAYADAAFESLLEVAHAAGLTLDGARVLDFGCGTGLLTERLAAHCATVDAVDTAPAMLARLRERVSTHGWDHVHAHGDLATVAGPFDLVVASSVLAFVDDHPATVGALASRLRDGGLLVHWDWEAETGDPDHAGLARRAVEDALAGAGLVGGTVETAFTIEADGERMSPLRAWGRRQLSAAGSPRPPGAR